jgi:SAM-dependent methyltransferase
MVRLSQFSTELTRVSRTGRTILQRGGLAAFSKWTYLHLYEQYRERFSGLDTSCTGKEVDNGEFKRYQPLPYASIRIILRAANLHEPGHGVLDYGCGLGRILIEAGRYPCSCVIGVEYDRELSQRAEANIELKRRSLRCQRAAVICMDAANYEVPADIDVIIMNNPFRGQLLRTVASRIRESLDQHPRQLRLFHVTNDDAPCLGEEFAGQKPLHEQTLGVFSEMVLRQYVLGSAR